MVDTEWSALIEVACIRTPERFAFALFDGTVGEEPFTALVTYDASHTQPWSRYDIPRFVADIVINEARSPLHKEGADYIVLSENGDLYVIGRGVENGIAHEAIPFLPDDDQDPTRYGTLVPTSSAGAVVAGDQVLIRNHDVWRANAPAWASEAPYGLPRWNAFAGATGDVFLVGEKRPSPESIENARSVATAECERYAGHCTAWRRTTSCRTGHSDTVAGMIAVSAYRTCPACWMAMRSV